MITSKDTYKVFSEFYDIYAGRFSDDLEFYRTHCDKSDKIIEVGCGTGRVLEFFLKSGFDMTGIDVSQEMLDKAEARLSVWIRNNRLRLFSHDLSVNQFPDCFDKVIISFYTFNYIIEKPEIFLKNVKELLNPGGILLMDLFYPNSLYDKSIDNVWIEKEVEFEERKIRIRDKRYIKDNIERRQQVYCIDGKEINVETDRKYYSPLQMKNLLANAGFKNVLFSSGYDLKGFIPIINDSKLRTNFIIKAEK